MIIRCWGARGSIPVSGPEYFKYGGDTTCMEIRSRNDDIIIVDAGTGIRKLGNRLVAEGRRRYHIIFTHAHWDHILGLPFFKPLYRKNALIRMFGCPFAEESIEAMMAKVMAAPNFPVNFQDVQAKIVSENTCFQPFRIHSLTVTPIRLSHPNKGMGYKFSEDGKSFVFMTDNELAFHHTGGLTFSDYVEFVRGADLLIHDAEYTSREYVQKKTWGHSRFSDALRLGIRAGVKRLGLFHHNQERTDEQIEAIVDECRRIIKKKKLELECFGVHVGMEVRL